jgi:hypothetical protein
MDTVQDREWTAETFLAWKVARPALYLSLPLEDICQGLSFPTPAKDRPLN